MLCRALLAVIALSYLICVLFLSGIQKDDLDVGLLKKLERYNVDLNAYDDKKLRQDCPNVTGKLGEDIEAANEQTETKKYVKDEATTVSNANVKTSDDEDSQFDKEQLSGLIKFWKKHRKTFKPKEQSEDPAMTKSIPEPINQNNLNVSSNKNNFQKDSRSNKNRPLDEILLNYFSIKDTIPSTTQHKSEEQIATTDSLLINKLFNKNHDIEKQLASNVAAINTLTENIVTLQNNLNKQQQPNLPDPMQEFKPSSLRRTKPNLIEGDVISKFLENIYDPSSYDAPERIPDYNTNSKISHATQNLIKTERYFKNPRENTSDQIVFVTEATMKNTVKDVIKPLSPEIINQIAETVKEIVLKDLKKDMTMSTAKHIVITDTSLTTRQTTTLLTTPSTISMSTATTSSATPTAIITSDGVSTSRHIDLAKVQVATQALENFMELFEKFKMVVPEKLMKQTEKEQNNQKLVLKPESLMPITVAVNPYKVKENQAKTFPSINQIPMMHEYMPPRIIVPKPDLVLSPTNLMSYMSPVNQVPQINTNRYPTGPIMIQTNSDEIKPIPVRMKTPELLNFNIILTTQNPHWTKEQRERWNFMMRYGRNPDDRDKIKIVKKTMSAYSNDEVVGHNMNIYNMDSKNERTKPEIAETQTDSVTSRVHPYDLSIRLNTLQKSQNYSHNLDNEPLQYKRKHEELGNQKIDLTNYGNKNSMNQNLNKVMTYSSSPDYKRANGMFLNKDYEKLKLPYSEVETFNRDCKQEISDNVNFKDYIQHNKKNQFSSHTSSTYGNKNSRILPSDILQTKELSENSDHVYDNLPRSKYFALKNDAWGKIKNNFQKLKQLDDISSKQIDLTKNSDIDYDNTYVKNVLKDATKDFPGEMGNIRKHYSHLNSLNEDREFINSRKTRLLPSIDARTTNVKDSRTQYQRGGTNPRYRNDERASNSDKRGHVGYRTSATGGYFDRAGGDGEGDIGSERNSFEHRQYKSEANRFNTGLKYRRPQAAPVDSETRYYMSQRYDPDDDVRRYTNNVRGYHERLEGGGSGLESVHDCGPDERCLLRVISRQQEPLAGKPVTHDDAHFKNFLKTQQKVNQMLERILATKSDVHSVETLK